MQSFIAVFCLIFAVNSAVHSYLVLRYAEGNKVAVNVGFYYMSNAAGRLIGTILSGVLYSYAGANVSEGFGWCFILSAAFMFLCTVITAFIKDDDAGLQCGPLICVGKLPVEGDEVDIDGGLTEVDTAKGDVTSRPTPVPVKAPLAHDGLAASPLEASQPEVSSLDEGQSISEKNHTYASTESEKQGPELQNAQELAVASTDRHTWEPRPASMERHVWVSK
jgi:hypothetical protein